MKKGKLLTWVLILLSLVYILISLFLDWETGKEAGEFLKKNVIEMIAILPCAFILIGLFESWVKRETVEKHLGEGAGWKSYLWVFLLGGITLGPMLVALPVASALWKKGAALSVIIAYLGASAVCRIPMTIFEASYLGIPFTLVRYLTAIPLVLVSALMMGRALKGKMP
ncbi:MAG: permease [Spirochaetales bacterium]|nr:permease [Spirochaetales bacterium]